MTKITEKRILAKATEILRAKYALESKFRPLVGAFFALCKASVRAGDSLPSSEGIINKYANHIVDTLFEGHTDRTKIKAKVIKSISKTVKVHWKSIDKTSNEKLKLSLQAARDAHDTPELKAAMSNRSLNLTASNIFDGYSQGRIDNIVISETTDIHNKARLSILNNCVPEYNAAIEDEDYDEAEDLADLADSIQIDDANDNHRIVGVVLIAGGAEPEEPAEEEKPVELMQTWAAVDDSDTCVICQELDGQTVPIGEPFTAGGEDYYDPGDTHNRCRCDIIM